MKIKIGQFIFEKGTIINVRVVDIVGEEFFIVAYKGQLIRVKNLSTQSLVPHQRISLKVCGDGHLEALDLSKLDRSKLYLRADVFTRELKSLEV